MKNIEQLITLARTFKYDEFSNVFLETIKSQNPYSIMKLLNKEINFIDQRTKKNSIEKAEFLNMLETLFESLNLETGFFKNIAFLELSYSQILQDRDIIQGEFDSIYILGIIFREIYFQNRKINEYLNHLDENVKTIHESMHRSKDSFNGITNPDELLSVLSKIITSNIKIESYRNNWFDKESQICFLPDKILKYVSDPSLCLTNNNFTEKLFVNSGLWDIVQELDFDFRLLEEDFIFNNDQLTVTENNKSILKNYALISADRSQRTYFNNFLKAVQITNNKSISTVLLERINFEVLLHIDINQNTEYDGLTILEWINSFHLLRAMVLYKDSPIILKTDILVSFFNNIHISKEKCLKVLQSLSFNKDTPDIFDTPIIRFTDDYLMIIPFGVISPNFINIISSILSKRKLSLEKKGESFEKQAFIFLNEQAKIFNFKTTQPYFKVDDKEYQYDILLEWDNYIFIIECKNRSIPNTLPTSIHGYWEKIDEYVNQVNRLKFGLETYPERIPVDLKNKIIVPVIMNSLPFSLDFKINGVIFTDYSIVKKFFSGRHLKITNGVDSSSDINICEQWSGDYPVVSDFLKAITSPFQVRDVKERLNSIKTVHKILSYNLTLNRYFIEPLDIITTKKIQT